MRIPTLKELGHSPEIRLFEVLLNAFKSQIDPSEGILIGELECQLKEMKELMNNPLLIENYNSDFLLNLLTRCSDKDMEKLLEKSNIDRVLAKKIWPVIKPYLVLILLNIFLPPHCTWTRYPDLERNFNPLEFYREDSILVQNLGFFIDCLESALKTFIGSVAHEDSSGE